MKRLAALTAIVLAAGTFAMAAPVTVTGVLVDRACYTKDKANTKMEHAGMGATCAADCAKKGQPVALVTSTGEVYTVTGEVAADNNAKLVPHMAHTMALTGEVTDVKGVKSISVAAAGLKMVSK
ncbi:MAG TPA: hypothetical protein VL243_12630 [Vicinamibacterales bacterium]|nr:hypothetical protein [Vicinamibacterales bacterium]